MTSRNTAVWSKRWRHLVVLLSFGLIATGTMAQCTTSVNGQYPSGTITPVTNGSTTITTCAFLSEYSVLSLTTGFKYVFTSSVGTDYMTVTDAAGVTPIIFGTGPLTFYPAATTTYRLYRSTPPPACGAQSSCRTITSVGSASTACLNSTYGLYPSGTFTPSCNGSTNVITTCGYASEYSNVNLTAGVVYTFSSSVVSDLITISDAAGTQALADGTGSLVYTPSATGTYRFYLHLTACGAQATCRNRQVSCPNTNCAGTPAPGNTTGPANACVGQAFTLGLQNATAGAGVTYQWQFDNGGGFTNFGAGAATQSTTQTVPTSYRCIVTCTASGFSGTSNVLSVGMNTYLNCYCVPTTTNGCLSGDHITNVTFGTINNSTGTCLSASYSDYSALSTSVGQTANVPISVSINNGGTEYGGAWIDYDQSGTFDASEFIVLNGGLGQGGGVFSGTAAVPLTATLGTTKLRVRSSYFSQVTSGSACATYSYGETEDYTVIITTPPSCIAPLVSNANVTAHTADISWTCSGCTGTYYVEYGLSGFTPGSDANAGVGGTIWTGGAVAGGPVTITGLNSSSAYSVYVRQDCGGGSFSANSQSSFTTGLDCSTSPVLACATPTTVTIPAGTGVWNLGSTFCSPPGTGAGPFCTNGQEKIFQFTATYAGTYDLNVSTTSSSTYVDYFFKPAGACDNSGWTYINDVFSPENASFTITTPGTYYLLCDPEGTVGATQTFTLMCPLPCATPSTIGAASITSTTASINWTCTGCTGSQFVVEYGPSGFALGTGTQVTSATSPVTINSLTPTTGYQAYVQQDCNNVGDSLSNWRGPVAFTTLAPPPVNDLCSDAITVTCGSIINSTNNAATADGLPSQSGTFPLDIATGVWYKYIGDDQQVTLDLCASALDTRVHVFRTSTDCSSLTPFGGNDDNCGLNGWRSFYTFGAVTGFTYYIAVDGYGGGYGSFNLTVSCAPLCTPTVANDLCIDRQLITMGTNCTPVGGNLGCATSTGGANPSCIGGLNTYPDAYYEFVATGPDAYINLSSVNPNLRFVLYAGNSCDLSTEFYCSPVITSGSPTLVTGMTTGSPYTLRVLQPIANAGTFTLCVQKLDVTDDPCAAIVLACNDLRFGRTTGYLNNIPSGACPFNGAASTSGVNYFSYTASEDADVTFSTCGQTAFNTRVSVFEGACTALTCNVMNDDAPGCPGNSSEVTVRAYAGTTYTVMVTGSGATNGNYQLSVFCQPWCSGSEANDRCANSITVPTYITGTGTPSTENQACSYADAPPSCSGASMVQGVWYDFTTGPNTIYDVYIGVNALDPNYTAPSMSYALYGGACSGVGASSEVACQLNASGTYNLPALTPFSNYKLLVYNTGGTNEGTFGLMVTHPAYNDGGISAIASPVDLVCDQKLFPQVWLKNSGEAALTSAQIISRIDGGIVQTYNWSGPAIQRGDSSLISLPVITSPLGVHSFTSEVSSVNGTTDELSSNNSASSTYDASGQTVKVVLRTDGAADQTSWVIYDAFFFPVGQGGQSGAYVGQNNQGISTTICLPTVFGNCYYFFVFDQAGDGMSTGSWLLTDVLDRPILQDNGAFLGQSPALSPATSGYFAQEFCLPLGPSTIQSGECGVFNNLLNNKVFTSTVAGVTSYQFEFSDPNAGFRRRIAVPRNWVKFSEMQSNPLAYGVTYFCRVRVDQGSTGFSDDFFGAGCEMALNPVQPVCTELISNPGPTLSCGVTKMFGGSDKIYAQPVTGATQYRFNFSNTGLGYSRNILRPTYVCLLSWVTQPLVSGNTYDVKVEALVSNVWSGFCGATCQVTIFNPAFNGGGGRSVQVDQQQLSGEMQLWPNPVVNDQVNVRIDGLANEDQQVSVDLYDIFGKRVMAENMDNSGAVFARTIELPTGIARGVYTMNITINGNSFTKRVTVQ